MIADHKAFLADLFRAAMAAADPRQVVPRHLSVRPKKGRTIVIGASKASALMALAFEEHGAGRVKA